MEPIICDLPWMKSQSFNKFNQRIVCAIANGARIICIPHAIFFYRELEKKAKCKESSGI